MPLLGDEGHKEMVSCLHKASSRIRRPRAIVVLSAHWETINPEITSAEQPALEYDYYGFPPESYEIQYPVKGDPQLAQTLYTNLLQHGITAKLNGDRGLDHGVFVPLKIMYPEADIPCLQLSLANHLNPEFHLALGKALQSLPPDILLLGSGFTFHNMREFFAPRTPAKEKMNIEFEQWLRGICSNAELDEASRWEMLANWESAPHARYCHPREEHLLPLHVCYGAAQRPCKEVFELHILDKHASMFLW